MKKLAVIILFMTNSICLAQGESVAALYNQANALYAQGQYAQAIELYEKALEGGFENSKVEYNLGNAYLKNNPPSIALAVLHYERAAKLDPRDPDVEHNLKYVNTLIKGKLPVADRSFIHRAWESLLKNVTAGETLAVLSTLYLAMTTALIIFFLARRDRMRKAMIVVASAALLLMVVEAPLVWGSLKSAGETKAVALEDDLAARSGPGPDNPELFKLFEGMVVKQNENRSGWIRVSLPNGLAGWIPAGKAIEI